MASNPRRTCRSAHVACCLSRSQYALIMSHASCPHARVACHAVQPCNMLLRVKTCTGTAQSPLRSCWTWRWGSCQDLKTPSHCPVGIFLGSAHHPPAGPTP